MKKIEFNIDEILQQTPEQYAGQEANQYIAIYVATFYDNGNIYDLFTIADLDDEYRGLVVVGEHNTIIKKLK